MWTFQVLKNNSRTKSVYKLWKITGGASPDILARPSLPLPDANLTPKLAPPSLPLVSAVFWTAPYNNVLQQNILFLGGWGWAGTLECLINISTQISMSSTMKILKYYSGVFRIYSNLLTQKFLLNTCTLFNFSTYTHADLCTPSDFIFSNKCYSQIRWFI